MKTFIISVLCFGLAFGAYDENTYYSCYKCDSKTMNVTEMVGDCWTLEGDFEITKEECHGCITRNIEENTSNGIVYEVERECLKYRWDQEELEREETSGCEIDDDGDKECWEICYANECNGMNASDGGSDAQALKLSFVFVIFSLIFN